LQAVCCSPKPFRGSVAAIAFLAKKPMEQL